MRTALTSLVVLLTFAAVAVGHETGTIRLAAKQVGVGGELVIHGEKLAKRTTLRMQLRGTLETFPLGEVRTGATGAFDARLALPPEARPGVYAVVVLAPDGDVTARAELTITAPAPAEMGPMEHAMMDSAHAGAGMPPARADMMDVGTATTAGEWIAIVAIIALSLGGGVALLFGARHPGA